MNSALEDRIRTLSAKEELTILITDSGLGGLAICAALAAGLKIHPLAPKIQLIYYNAWPAEGYSYNLIADNDERIRVFEQALAGMERFRPDLILIACNTLSVLYPRTDFSKTTQIPVMDIIAFGTDLIRGALESAPHHRALILGTQTTIAARTHIKCLVAQGIDPGRLFAQPCHLLATEIEKGPASKKTVAMVDRFMGQAADQIESIPGDLFAALCCTHYGYCRELIKERLEAHLPGRKVTIVNPNDSMAENLFDLGRPSSVDTTRVGIRVVSKIICENQKIETIGSLLSLISQETVDALEAYEQIPDLFTF